MKNKCPWIIDLQDNILKVYLNDKYELVYKICDNGVFGDERIIDRNVVEFSICLQDEMINIVYINNKQEVRYCTQKEEKWFGEKLYDINADKFNIEDLKIVILQGKMHIFYLMSEMDGSNHGILKHCLWNGEEIKLSTIQHIVLSESVYVNYRIQIDEEKNIDIFFISYIGNEQSFNYMTYRQNKWSSARRLYGIQGDKIMFQVINTPYEFNIVNKLKDGNVYSLEHVLVGNNMKMREFEIYKGIEEPLNPIMIYAHNKLFSAWNDKKYIFLSKYSFGKWDGPLRLKKPQEVDIETVNLLSRGNNEIPKIVYAKKDDKVHIVNFKELSKAHFENLPEKEETDNLKIKADEESIDEIKEKFKEICYENNVLKEKIESFSSHMKKKKLIQREYEEKIDRMLDERKKLKENLKFFMEVRQNIQKELDEAKRQVAKKNASINNIKSNLNKNNRYIKIITEELKAAMDENAKLKEQLEVEKNQSFVTKLFKKRE